MHTTRNTIRASALMLLSALGLASVSGCGRPAVAEPRPDMAAATKIREKLAEGGDSGGTAEAASTGTGWSTLRGTFKYVGTPPQRPRTPADKDPEVCGKNGGVPDERLVVSSDGGIANVVIYARAKRVHESAQPLPPNNNVEPILFDQKDCVFLTHVLACQVNQKIGVKNSDPVGHNTNVAAVKGAGVNLLIPTDQTLGYTPNAEEAAPLAVSCNIHPFMRAYLLPRKDKYFAVTKADGSFEIPNLPAGEDLELQVWHEQGTGAGGGLVLDRKDLKWTNKGRFKVKLEADKPMDLTLEVPPSSFR